VLARVSVSSKLLRDAVMSIPDVGFDKNPAQTRNALLNKIDALDQLLAAGDLVGARNKLQNDIRKQLVAWLKDSYPIQSPLEYTKPAILALVDELLQRLGGNNSTAGSATSLDQSAETNGTETNKIFLPLVSR
jgi:hypothetical protein